MSNFKSPFSLTGEVCITLRKSDGSIKERTVHNLVVTVGKQHVADQLAGLTQASMSHMAIGEGTTAADLIDTQLEAEVAVTGRKPFDSKTQGSGADANKIVYITDWPSGEGNGAITEAGIFNAASSGIMLCRTTFPVKNKEAGDSLTFTWTVSVN